VAIHGVRAFLKDHTAALHGTAEMAFEARAPVETQDGLVFFLNCMLNSHLQFNAEYDRASKLAGLKPQSAPLIDALRADLPNRVSPRQTIPSNCDLFNLGVGYVFEGSAMGANVLKKRIAKSNLKTPRYLLLLTESARMRWPHYVRKLDSCSESEKILAGAEVAFKYIIAQARND